MYPEVVIHYSVPLLVVIVYNKAKVGVKVVKEQAQSIDQCINMLTILKRLHYMYNSMNNLVKF